MDYTIEKNLLQGLQAGDDAAFEHLRKTCYESVAFIVKTTSGSKEDEEDLYSEGIEILIQVINAPDFVLRSKVRTLLINICRRKNIDKLHRQKARQNYLNQNRDDSYEENFEELIDRKVFQGILWTSFKKIKEDCQTLLKRVFDNAPLTVIAQEMGITAGALRNKKKNCLVTLISIINAHPQYTQMVNNAEIVLDSQCTSGMI
jgi:RNA polymerase sigma factor (sigma-70 family)